MFKRIFYNFIPSAHISAYIRLLYLRKFLKRLTPRKTLDAGCGPGLFTFFTAKMLPQTHIYGYDLSLTDINYCKMYKIKKQINNVGFKQVDLIMLSEKLKYDLVISIDVLEHIRGNIQVLKNIFKALKPNGTFYLAMPFEPGYRYLFPKKYFSKYISWAQLEHVGEQYNITILTQILITIGFKIVHAQYTFGFWGKLARELDMLTHDHMTIKHLLQPLLFIFGYLDTIWKNKIGSYGTLVIARK